MVLNTMFTGKNSQKVSRYLSSPVYCCRVWWIQNRLQFEQHYRDSVSPISSVKNSSGNTIKISAVILSRANDHEPDCDKPEKINISIRSGCCQ